MSAIPEKRDSSLDVEEAALIGGLLQSPDLVAELMDVVSVSDFGNPSFAALYAIIVHSYRNGALPTMAEIYDVSLRIKNGLRIRTWPKDLPWPLETTAVPKLLAELYAECGTATGTRHNASLVRDNGIRKRIHRLGIEFRDLALRSISGEEALDSARSRLSEIELDTTSSDIPDFQKDVAEVVQRFDSSNATADEIPYGIANIDNATIGMRKGAMVVVAARPGVGKTALLVRVALNIAMGGQPILIFSMEQSRTELIERMISSLAQVCLKEVKSGKASQENLNRLYGAAETVRDLPITILESTHSSISKVVSFSRKLRMSRGVECVFVDYLQLMTGGDRGTPRHERVADFSRQLKLLAGELQIPIVALCQLNRESEKRADEKPKMSDLRESGAIEQDADTIILLHKLKWEQGQSRDLDYVDALIEKQRNGPTGIAHLEFMRPYTLFRDKVQW